MGVENTHISGPDTHPAFIVNMASVTTIPLGSKLQKSREYCYPIL